VALKEPENLRMEINHREVTFPEGASVLRAAELNGIYIPALCSHKDLSPFGSCRMCMVEIEGMRGYPLACDTLAREGMKILTDTVKLKELRSDILQLILSEHPSSCLVCDESDECRDYQSTIHKTGVTTGCRYCPNDDQCELQDVVEKVGVTEIDYPIYYHGYEPEIDDPFFGRDYNVCILCGRCVRMCQEVRGTSVLAFTHRGPHAKIGTAFDRNHIEAGCEFCGACVDICPTGALADKVSKWDGKPDGFHISTCPVCGLGCQVELYYKNGTLSKVKAHLDEEINDGQLCVKGRFCLPELTHHFARAKKPVLKKGPYMREVTWDEAVEVVAGKLKDVAPRDFLMLVSPDLTNESLFAAGKFARVCLSNGGIDSTAGNALPGGPGLWSQLFSSPISIRGVGRSDRILVLGLDSRFHFSVVGVEVRRALKQGAELVVIDPRDSNLARSTKNWLRPTPATESALLGAMADALAGGSPDIEAVAASASLDPQELARAIDILSSGNDLTVVIGPQVFSYSDTGEMAAALEKLISLPDTNLVPLYIGANTRGALELGLIPEPQAGDDARQTEEPTLKGLLEGSAAPKVLYLVGEVPLTERPDCEYIIAQDIYAPPFEIDAFLPAASFAESGGTLVNVEGRVQETVKVEDLPDSAITGFARPDWKIFSMLAEVLGNNEMKYDSPEQVLAEIGGTVPGFPTVADRAPRGMKSAKHPVTRAPVAGNTGDGAFLLVVEPAAFRHRSIDMSSKVEGLGVLALEEGFRMNAGDLAALGADGGQKICISLGDDGPQIEGTVKEDPECPAGVIYCTRPAGFGGHAHRHVFETLHSLKANPVRVDITVAEKFAAD
jgi:predicted molibdopterin-dependent oxidoreductase YjgC